MDPALPPIVTLSKSKPVGGISAWQGYLVREDEHGRWLFTPAGSLFRYRDGEQALEFEVEGGGGPGLDSLVLVPPSTENWVVEWRVPARDLHMRADVCGWTRRRDDLVAFVDWELDPVRLRSGWVGVEDLDDYVHARAEGTLGPEDAEVALLTAASVEHGYRTRTAPFDDRGDALLAECGALRLPPLREVPDPWELLGSGSAPTPTQVLDSRDR